MEKEIKTSRIILAAIGEIVNLLNTLDINYALMGGMALQVWGRERVSKDVDIVVNVETDKLKKLISHLEKPPFSMRSHLKRIGKSLLIFSTYKDRETSLPIDVGLFIAQTPFEKEALKRSLEIEVLGLRLKVITAENLILYKLLAKRPIDIVDVQGIMRENSDLDRSYLRIWAKRLDLERDLEKMLRKNA